MGMVRLRSMTARRRRPDLTPMCFQFRANGNRRPLFAITLKHTEAVSIIRFERVLPRPRYSDVKKCRQ